MSSTEGASSPAAEANVFAQLAPDPALLRAIATAGLCRARNTVRDCARELASDPEQPLLAAMCDALPGDTVAESPEAKAHLDSLIERVKGRTPYERLLSVHLVGGIVHDALVGYGKLRTPAVDLGEEYSWDAHADRLRDYFIALFARDTHMDDRLAMWGRRVAGDAVLWTRRVAGIPDGNDADTLYEGAEHGAEAFVSALFANHSRRMNAMALAA